jgi:glycerol-3-phosphate dehydrogenase (NAD(P)+)
MGDMIATCTSPQSRNRHVGIELGRGRNMPEILAEMVMVAEGVKSAPTVLALSQQYGVEMPIARDVYRVLSGDDTASRAFRGLLRVTFGAESEPG